jgi:hypothetical protein
MESNRLRQVVCLTKTDDAKLAFIYLFIYLQLQDGKAGTWNGSIWLRIETGGGLL